MFQSTRSSLTADAHYAVLHGLAPDGGLYVDPDISGREFDVKSCLSLSYCEMAKKIIAHLLPGFGDAVQNGVDAYLNKFSTSEITPLVKVGDDYILELFHGPTSAFKDVALTVLPYLVTEAKSACGVSGQVSVLTATSGDTGKAALEGFHDVPGTDITVFFPNGGVSAMQRMQMVTQEGSNVRVCAVNGNFDDCQRGVKETFSLAAAGKLTGSEGKFFSSANSINIGRLVPQAVYYFYAYSKLLQEGRISFGDPVDYVVPTGNFGDILAGYLAKLMGLPVGRLVCASNSNNVLYDFITTGTYDRRRDFLKTVSPSMDILVSSNLERLLFYASGCSTDAVAKYMSELNKSGVYSVSGDILANIQGSFSAGYASETDCLAAIGKLWKDYGYLCDTHTAVAYSVLEGYKASREGDAPCVVLSTASPFKFPVAVMKAIGGDASGDDFETALKLSEATGVPVPKNLASLAAKPVLHSDVIEINDITNYCLEG